MGSLAIFSLDNLAIFSLGNLASVSFGWRKGQVGCGVEKNEEDPKMENSLKAKTKQTFSLRYVYTRVARWFVFKPIFQIWVNFGGSRNRKSWYIL
jgi:hypothetical protein